MTIYRTTVEQLFCHQSCVMFLSCLLLCICQTWKEKRYSNYSQVREAWGGAALMTQTQLNELLERGNVVRHNEHVGCCMGTYSQLPNDEHMYMYRLGKPLQQLSKRTSHPIVVTTYKINKRALMILRKECWRKKENCPLRVSFPLLLERPNRRQRVESTSPQHSAKGELRLCVDSSCHQQARPLEERKR
eukprot:5897193-Amphidinium_carterae.1